MSQLLIQQYLNNLQDLRKVGGKSRESIETPARGSRYVDGALLHELRVPFGYWEAKDEKDDLDQEIAHKFKRGYPHYNIISEDLKIVIPQWTNGEIKKSKALLGPESLASCSAGKDG